MFAGRCSTTCMTWMNHIELKQQRIRHSNEKFVVAIWVTANLPSMPKHTQMKIRQASKTNDSTKLNFYSETFFRCVLATRSPSLLVQSSRCAGIFTLPVLNSLRLRFTGSKYTLVVCARIMIHRRGVTLRQSQTEVHRGIYRIMWSGLEHMFAYARHLYDGPRVHLYLSLLLMYAHKLSAFVVVVLEMSTIRDKIADCLNGNWLWWTTTVHIQPDKQSKCRAVRLLCMCVWCDSLTIDCFV